MVKRKKKILLSSLIGLYCLGISFQIEAGRVYTAEELTASGGVVTIDATNGALGPDALGIRHNGSNEEKFIYTGDVQVNIRGYDLATVPGRTRVGIVAATTDLILGKTTLTWRNDDSNQSSDVTVEGIRAFAGSTITLGAGSTIDIEANSSNAVNGLYAGNNATNGPGNIILADQTTVLVKNQGTGVVRGINAYDGADISTGNHLDVNVSGGNAGARALEVGFNSANLSIGSDTNVVANSVGGTALGVFVFYGGLFNAQENLTVQVDSTTAAYGLYARDSDSKIELNGATVGASKNGVAGTGSSLVAMNGATIQGNLGKYDLTGNVVSSSGAISFDFDRGSAFTGASQITGTGVINFDMTDTTWNMTGDSKLSSLAFNDNSSNIIFAGDNTFKTLSVGELSGSDGVFTMRTDIVGDGAGNNGGDILQVTGTSAGNHFVRVQNNGSVNATGNETLTIVRTEDGVATFQNTHKVDLGGYEFSLRDVAGSNQKEWELYGTKKSTTTGSAGVNLFAGSYLLNYAETQTLMKRMGDLRQGDEKGNIWGRVYGGKFHSSSDSFLKDFDINYTGIQVGADKKFVRKDGRGTDYLGGFFGYTRGNLDYGQGSGNVDSKSFGGYWTHEHHNGFYADGVLKYGWMKNDFDVLDSAGTRVTGEDISTQGFTASMEVGRRYHLDQKDKNGWYVEPQAQLTGSHQNGDRFTASNGLNVKVDSFSSVLGRVGTHIGYEAKSGRNPINVYGKVSIVKEFDGEVNYSFNGSKENTSYQDTWLSYGIGVTGKVGNRHNLYLDIERATAGQFTQSWALNGGYRFTW